MEQVNSLMKRSVWGTGIGGNYIWCLGIVVIFMGLGGAKSWAGRFPIKYGRILSSLKKLWFNDRFHDGWGKLSTGHLGC